MNLILSRGMTTTRIRDVSPPRKLPEARIYLDDLAEIERILITEYRNLVPPKEISFVYEIDDTTRCDSLQELEQIGGHAKDFIMRLAGEAKERSWEWRHTSVLNLKSFEYDSSPSFQAPTAIADKQWELHAKVNLIFHDKRLKIRNWFTSLSVRIQVALQMLVFPLLGVLVGVLAGFIVEIYRHHSRPSVLQCVIILIISSVIIFLGSSAYLTTRRSKVYLYYQRDRDKTRKAERKALTLDLVKLVFGALLGMAATLAVQWLSGGKGH
jgi:hypothetical protein